MAAITAEDLASYRAELEQQKTQTKADLFALDGALQLVAQIETALTRKADAERAEEEAKAKPPARKAPTRKKEK